ncbi:MAG: UDP-N-acetylmuramate--L-alanine ligase [Bacteroidales bacterium]|nr:UDP-N-acetylmuramate--L-alanine ligase [Bacteroidales bacterium]
MKKEDLRSVENIYMIGIGGIGMSALARYFLSLGKTVTGYDRVSTRLTDDLIREGSDIHFTTDLAYVKEKFTDVDNLLVIYTPAIPADHLELSFFRKGGYQMMKRAELLGIISDSENCIAVAGTHGKTTVTTMVTHLLKVAGIKCNAFLGGISKNYKTNSVLSGEEGWMVLEADEFDRSFLHLHPDICIVTSCDPDHLDVYGSVENLKNTFCQFISQTDPDGHIIYHQDVPLDCIRTLPPKSWSYALEDGADFTAVNLSLKDGLYRFDVETPEGLIADVGLGVPGLINIENALSVVGLARLLNIGDDLVREALSTFSGVQRRFDVMINRTGMVYIDDYAHHPRELDACIQSVRKIYPDRKITGIFQPHLYSRTRDFAGEFARSLSNLDELILLDIYPAREAPVEGVDSRLIFDQTDMADKVLINKEQLLLVLEERQPEVLLTLGAGDIDQFVEPIVKLFGGGPVK